MKYCIDPEHKYGYQCMRCNHAFCRKCHLVLQEHKEIKTDGGNWCPRFECQREKDIEHGKLEVRPRIAPLASTDIESIRDTAKRYPLVESWKVHALLEEIDRLRAAGKETP